MNQASDSTTLLSFISTLSFLPSICMFPIPNIKLPMYLLDCKEIQPVHPKGDQSWVFTGRTDVEAKTPILWPPDANS